MSSYFSLFFSLKEDFAENLFLSFEKGSFVGSQRDERVIDSDHLEIVAYRDRNDRLLEINPQLIKEEFRGDCLYKITSAILFLIIGYIFLLFRLGLRNLL